VGVRRLIKAHGLVPDTSLGQHFLVDENYVDVAIREAEVSSDDVVLEVGPGVGVLTVALSRVARHVHAIEIDRRLEPVLLDALGSDAEKVDIRYVDAMKADLESLVPAPTKFVANLPYSIATPIVVESTWRLPKVERWSVMTQREVADRWAAEPGSRLYGAPTVLLRLACELTHRRVVGPEAFSPRPRVDSSLVSFRRTAPGADSRTRALVRAAFGTRRKTTANALSGAGYDKDAVEEVLFGIGCAPGIRPEQISPTQFAELAEAL
jgi:16S rRNA (adenine1518-N6/adenine1519-N6)-dimethyltransferase